MNDAVESASTLAARMQITLTMSLGDGDVGSIEATTDTPAFETMRAALADVPAERRPARFAPLERGSL